MKRFVTAKANVRGSNVQLTYTFDTAVPFWEARLDRFKTNPRHVNQKEIQHSTTKHWQER